jgi:hypothetical protein
LKLNFREGKYGRLTGRSPAILRIQ